jgi:GNAT superfamily N-acetyltransferase
MERPDHAKKGRTPRATVEFPGSNARDVLRVATAIIGKRVKSADLASLAGVTHDALVQVVNPAETILTIAVVSPGHRFAGRLVREADESLELHIDDIFVPETLQRTGVGTRSISRMIRTSQRLGLHRIRLLAMRGGSYIGYKVWPKFGFDGPLKLPPEMRATLPEHLRSISRLSDLYHDLIGAEWWESNGFSLALEFDLSPGSRSLLIWADYLKRKNR